MLSSKEMGLYDEAQMLKTVETKLKDIYNINTGEKRLKLKNVTFGDYNYDPNDWNALKQAKLEKKTVGRPYYGEFELEDDSGKVIDKRKVRFGVLPVNTALDNFMVDGNYYSIPVQFRLKPGAYTRETIRGDVEVFHNFANGVPMRTHIDPETKSLTMKVKQSTVPLYSVLNIMDVPDREISRNLGKEIYQMNASRDVDKDAAKLYRSLFRKAPPSPEKARSELKDYFNNLETTPEVNERTIKTPTKYVDGQYLLNSSRKLIDIVRQEEKPDNRDDLIYKDVFGTNEIMDDLLERMKRTHKLDWKVKRKMQSDDSIAKIINRNDVNKSITQVFTSSDLSRFSDQTNPLANELNKLTTTLLGEGGIASPHMVTDDAKALQASHAAFLDPNHTPESASGGVTLFLAKNTVKDEGTLKTKVIELRSGNAKWLTPADMHDNAVAFPGEFHYRGGKWVADEEDVVCVEGGKTITKRAGLVRYMMASADGLFDLSSNTIPFIQNNQANRMLTSSKMATQASTLANPEKPLVDVSVGGSSILDTIGRKYSVSAKVSGTVSEIGDDYIIVDSRRGKIKHSTPRNMPLNADAFLDSKVRVSVGDKVKKGDILADSNSTVDGKLATGVNLNIAYLPYNGLNYEDATVITESAAKKLSTEHMHRIHVPKKNIFDLDKYRAYSPYDIDKDSSIKFDEKGIVKPGTVLSPDDILAATMKEREFSLADSLISRLKKSAVAPLKPEPVLWDRSMSGVVTDVKDVPGGTDIYVKTVEPVLPGDKVVGRHGNKTTVSMIIPDELAPRTKDGDVIDIIMDPLSVPPRINMGQILETAAGKLAKKTGEPFMVENFSGKDYRKAILEEMKKKGISDKDDIIDPRTGAVLPGVFNGVQYIHKLKHQVENKMSARGIDGPYNINQQPTRGKGTGGQSVDRLSTNILLSHDARNILRENFSIKNNPNREYWRAIQNGEIPPAPSIPYEYEKFEAMLKGMGVNTEHIGTTVKLTPLTDDMVKEMSAGEIKKPYRTFRLKKNDIDPDPSGLFGKDVGGISGNVFNHVSLPSRIAAPAYKEAIKSVLGITEKEYNKLLEE